MTNSLSRRAIGLTAAVAILVGLAGYCAWRLDVINRLGWAGFSYVPPVGKTSTAQPLMGLQPGSVFMVFPGAPAERAGLRRGDIIFGINGIPASELRRDRKSVV